MKAQNIRVGATLALTREAKERYGMEGPLQVIAVETRNGYLTPWVVCPDPAYVSDSAFYFKPSDFKREVESCA